MAAIEYGRLIRWLSLLILLSSIASAQFELSINGRSCENVCQATYNRSQGVDDVGYCCRGCRLMRLVEFASGSKVSVEGLAKMCSSACLAAYGGDDNLATRACTLGCKTQIPQVQLKRQQLEQFYREESEYLMMMSWINRLMSYRLRPAVYSSSSFDSSRGGFFYQAEVVVVGSGNSGVLSIKSSQKSSDRTADDIMKSAKNRWWQRGTDVTTPAAFVVFTVGFLLLLGFCFVLCHPTHDEPTTFYPQKLSIYGDAEILSPLSEDEPLIDIKSRAHELMAPPAILTKIPMKSI